jgi:hypothetical protein
VRERTAELALVQSPKPTFRGKGTGFADTVRDSMFRRGNQDLPADYIQQVGVIQARRKAYPDPKQFFPLQINVPQDPSLSDITNCFENPRKAPLPRGPKYNCRSSNLSLTPDITGTTYWSRLTIDMRITEFSDLTQASVFSLPKFDPEQELRKLQSLWSKRSCLEARNFLTSSRSPIFDKLQEQSFFENDSEDEDESPKRYADLRTWLI